jgi:hypothetical protein
VKTQDNTGRWYASSSPEHYYIGPHDTMELAVAEYMDENDGEKPAYVGQARSVFCSIDGHRIIENIPDDMCDNPYADMFDGWCERIPSDKLDDLGERLTKVLHEWLDEIGEAKCWDLIEERRFPEEKQESEGK